MPDQPCRLRNVSNRPVEVHHDGGPSVLPPGGVLDVDAIDAYCAALIRQGTLSRHARPAPVPAVAAKPKPKRTAKRQRKATTGGPQGKAAATTKTAPAKRKGRAQAAAPSRRKAAKPKTDDTGEAR